MLYGCNYNDGGCVLVASVPPQRQVAADGRRRIAAGSDTRVSLYSHELNDPQYYGGMLQEGVTCWRTYFTYQLCASASVCMS